MDIVTRVLTGTPWWVYGVLALLVWLGLQASRPRTVDLGRVLIAPAVFIVWGIISLMLRPNFSGALVWSGSAVCGTAFAVLVSRVDGLVADRRVGLVRIPGSIQPLVRFLAIFIAKFTLAVAASIRPDLRDFIAPLDIGVSGLAAGYFVGWFLAFLRAYRGAPDAELGLG